MEALAKLVSEYPAFFDAYGTITLVVIVALLVLVDWRLSKQKRGLVIRTVRLLIVVLVTVSSVLIYCVNIPFKPMIDSLTAIDQQLNTNIHDLGFMNIRTGVSESMLDYNEDLVFLNLWGTFCGPCIEEFNDLVKLEKQYANKVTIVALSIEEKDRIQQFIEQRPAPSVIGKRANTDWVDPEAFLPITVILYNGIIVDRFFGKLSYAQMEQIVKDYSF